MCIASGIFYREPIIDVDENEDFLQVTNDVKKCSEMAGYRVLEEKAMLGDGQNADDLSE